MSLKYQSPKDGAKATAKETDETLKKNGIIDASPKKSLLKSAEPGRKRVSTEAKKQMSPTPAIMNSRVSQNLASKPPASAVRRGLQNTPPSSTTPGVKRASQNTPPKRGDSAGTPAKSTLRRGSNGTPPNTLKRGPQNTTPTKNKQGQLHKSPGKKINGSPATARNTPQSTELSKANQKDLGETTLKGNDRVLKCKHLLQHILLLVEPSCIGNCSMVCKLWNSCLSRKEQKFWYKWGQYHFDVRPAQLSGCLYDWSHSCRFLQKLTNTTKQRTVFTCVPSRWNCGVIVPSTFVPYGFDPNPDIDYMALATAVHKLKTLLHKSQLVDAKCVADGNEEDSDIEVVLLPWKGKKFPKAVDVLNMLHVSDDIIKTASDVEIVHIDPDEPEDLEENFLVEDIDERDEYYKWLAKIFKKSISFQAGEDVLSHRMHFFLSKINVEYIGGLIAATT